MTEGFSWKVDEHKCRQAVNLDKFPDILLFKILDKLFNEVTEVWHWDLANKTEKQLIVKVWIEGFTLTNTRVSFEVEKSWKIN